MQLSFLTVFAWPTPLRRATRPPFIYTLLPLMQDSDCAVRRPVARRDVADPGAAHHRRLPHRLGRSLLIRHSLGEYRVTHKVDKRVGLTLIRNVTPSSFGSMGPITPLARKL